MRIQNSPAVKLVAVLVAALLVHVPSAQACDPEMCVGPCTYEPLVWDYNFNQGCDLWIKTSGVTVDTSNGGSVTIGGTGTIYQELDAGGTFVSMAMAIWITGITGNAGSERYRLTINSDSGALLETVDVFWPYENPSGQYYYEINNYSGQDIRVKITRIPGTSAGDSVMKVDGVQVWGFYFE